MKIAIFYDDRVRPDSTAVYFPPAFKALGLECDHFYPEQMQDVPLIYDLYLKIDDGLGKTFWRKDFHPSVYYCIDTHIEWDWRVAIAKEGEFDQVSVTQRAYKDLPWSRHCYWNPPCADPIFHTPEKRDKKYDICFVGNFHTQYAGQRIDVVHAAFEAAPNFFYGHRTFNELAEKYAESRIVLNKPINKDINMRFFEAMASGSCLLTEYLPDAELLGYKEGVHYSGYSDIPSLKEKIKFLLDNPEKREEMAAAGKAETLRAHTYIDRCRKILEQLSVNTKGEPCLR